MNEKTAKRLRKFAKTKESNEKRIEKFYNNAKRKFTRANIWQKTKLNQLINETIEK